MFQVPWLRVVAAGDILTEVVIILLPVIGLRNLHMPMKRRLLVVIAFSFRVPYAESPIPSPRGRNGKC